MTETTEYEQNKLIASSGLLGNNPEALEESKAYIRTELVSFFEQAVTAYEEQFGVISLGLRPLESRVVQVLATLNPPDIIWKEDFTGQFLYIANKAIKERQSKAQAIHATSETSHDTHTTLLSGGKAQVLEILSAAKSAKLTVNQIQGKMSLKTDGESYAENAIRAWLHELKKEGQVSSYKITGQRAKSWAKL